ncbi:amino acid adenylation domain-containing protein [Catellatospora sp. KI3]|uniref:non-ribosomal peptide synthetase n=1 Tax=Catellatospora sp. KI3 TaxID=3041620 RepID=UPI0024829126|nr:amino acid adenylation domain-containing protein [Catellatospora sp. KI3]MDI1464729.1 amino acid adenylation domain-containing protein [Catellatospora sp. KI3]
MTQALDGIPVTLAQQGVWFTERVGAADTAYRLAVAVTLPGPADPDRLDQAWAQVADRHPALAVAVTEHDGEPLLRAVPAAPVAYRTGDLDTVVADELKRPFDLAQGPLARCSAIHTDLGTTVLVVAHHLIFDGASKDVLVADLLAAYDGRPLPSGSPAELGAAARAQAQRIAEGTAAAREFWATRPSPSGEVALPYADGPVTAAEPHASVRFSLGADLDAALTANADTLGLTRFEQLLAAVHAVLARYGNTTTSVAVDLTTRTPDLSGEIGMWVNELPVTVAPDLDQPWAAFAHTVRAEARAVYRHREVPLGRAVPGLTPRLALAPVSVSYRRRGDLDADVHWELVPPVVRTALHLQLVDSAAGLAGSVYVPARHAPAAERFFLHLTRLLESAVADPQRPVRELDLLTADEQALLAAGNATDRPRRAATVLDLVREQADRSPDATAVSGTDGELTYRQLVQAAHRVGNGLRARGVADGDLVGLCARRSTELVAGVLGILAAGAAYLPLDPSYPQARLEFIAADAGAKVILGHTGGPLDVLALDGLAVFAAEPDTAPQTGGDPDALAYAIYTSGSTGRPKGVEIGHAALANLIAAMAELLGTDPAHRWLNLTSLSFDISGLELFLPLTTGARVIVAPDAATREGAALDRLIRDSGATHVQATPSTWRMLLDADFAGAPITALCGGEPLPPPLARRLRERTARLLNVYGPTETTIWSTAAEIPADPQRITIGGPLANTTLHVLDESLRPLPPGVPGELCIGGAGLARGYRGRPELTGQKFVTVAGQRLYRTGDLVRLGADGQVEFLGRVDDQIKLRGHRIELGEIEQTLLGAAGVGHAAVAVRGCTLVAYLVGAGDLPEIRRHLSGTLPRYMMPGQYVWLDRLPLTPNGKLDRRALPEPPALAGSPAEDPADELDGACAAAPETAAVPGGDLLAQVTAIWCEVLRIDDIAPDDTLFDLGGHSLTITQITARVRDAYGVEVPFDVFFDTPTVEGVVASIEELLGEQA